MKIPPLPMGRSRKSYCLAEDSDNSEVTQLLSGAKEKRSSICSASCILPGLPNGVVLQKFQKMVGAGN